MKKLFLIFLLPCIVHAQTNTFPSNGGVGIGTLSPRKNLETVGVGMFSSSASGSGIIIDGSQLPATNTWSSVQLTAGGDGGSAYLKTSLCNWGGYFSWTRGSSSGDVEAMRLDASSGRLGIGTSNPLRSLSIQSIDGIHTGANLSSSNRGLALIENGTAHYVWGYENEPLIFGSNATERMRIDAGGNVGIGTTSPQFKLDVDAQAARIRNSSTSFASYTSFRVQGAEYTNGLEIDFFGQSNVPNTQWTYNAGIGGAAIINVNAKPLVFGTANTDRMIIDGAGNIGIGTPNPQAKLAVNGDIFSKKVKVTQAGWPDYVFHSDYNLLPLKDLENYIKQSNHLPDVPSASDVEKNGLDLGESQSTLLKKIEELTMYLIDLNKKVDQLTEENKNLKKLISTVNK